MCSRPRIVAVYVLYNIIREGPPPGFRGVGMGSELSAELNPSIMCRSMNHLSTDHHRQDRACMGYRVSEYASCLRTKTIYPVPSPLGTSRVSTFVTLETCWLARMARLNHSCFEHSGPGQFRLEQRIPRPGRTTSHSQDMHFHLQGSFM